MKKIVFGAAMILAALPAYADMMVHDISVRLGIGDRPGVMFATLHNKGAATSLIAADSPAFERIELHTHQHTADGMMRMVKVERFDIPAEGMLSLKPGGDHLMLFGFRGETGDNVTITLTFADGRTLAVSGKTEARKKKSHKMKMNGHGGHHGH